MCDCTCPSKNDSETRKCPICHTPGQSVPFETVKSLVGTPALANEENTAFFICLAPDCKVIYFGHNAIFLQKDVPVPVGFKTEATPKFVCYCNRVTEGDIIRAVVDGGAKTIGDIARLTGAMKNGKCLTTNPKGTCCHKDIETVIQSLLLQRHSMSTTKSSIDSRSKIL